MILRWLFAPFSLTTRRRKPRRPEDYRCLTCLLPDVVASAPSTTNTHDEVDYDIPAFLSDPYHNPVQIGSLSDPNRGAELDLLESECGRIISVPLGDGTVHATKVSDGVKGINSSSW